MLVTGIVLYRVTIVDSYKHSTSTEMSVRDSSVVHNYMLKQIHTFSVGLKQVLTIFIQKQLQF